MDQHEDLQGNLNISGPLRMKFYMLSVLTFQKRMFLRMKVWPDIQALNKRITEMIVQKLVFPVLASSIERKLKNNLPMLVCNSQGSSCGMDVAAHHSFIQSNILLISVAPMFSAHVH